MRVAELARFALRISQRGAEDRVRAALRSGHPVSCRKGCAACCRHAVPVSPPEAWMLADLVRGLPDAQRCDILARFGAAASALESAGMSEAPLLSRADDYFSLSIACPFLAEEACRIHRQRPAVCRDYLVISPAYMCAQPRLYTISTLPPQIRISECLSKVAGDLFGWGLIMVPLVRALDWAAQHEREGDCSWDAGYLKGLLLTYVTGAAGKP